MALTGGTNIGWVILRWSNVSEYREVSEDGTEENTKTQNRTNSTFVVYNDFCNPTGFSSDVDTNVLNPTGDLCGTTITLAGTWTVTEDSIDGAEKGGIHCRNTQVYKKFTTWSDYTIP